MDKMKADRVYISKTEVLKRATEKKNKLINGDFVPPDPIDEILAVADAGLLDDIVIEPPKKKVKKKPKKEPPIQQPPEVAYIPPETPLPEDPIVELIVEEIIEESIPLSPEEKKALRKIELLKQIEELEAKE